MDMYSKPFINLSFKRRSDSAHFLSKSLAVRDFEQTQNIKSLLTQVNKRLSCASGWNSNIL